MFARLTAPMALAGAWVVGTIEYAGQLGLLLAQAVGWSVYRPVRPGAIAYEVWKIGVQSLLITTLCSFFIGMVLALQSAYQMQQLGAEMYIASLVSLSVVREIGPVITALVVAGRCGSAIAAELGTMKVTEQIDALMTLAVDPVRHLVVPRLVAGFIALPVLTLWADAVGIFGGFVIGTVKLNILPSLYWKLTTVPLVFKDVASGLLKAAVFGVVITTVSCLEGFQARGGSEGVGRSATRAVVSSFLLVIASDCLFTALFYFVWR